MDQEGAYTDYTTNVVVNEVAPTPNAGGPYSSPVGKAISFNGSATDPSQADTAAGFTFNWNFGDGSTATGAAPTHAYAASGTYTVTLTATDTERQSGSVTTTATVTGLPTVTQTTPANGAVNLQLNTTVTATFSNAMDATTLTTSTVLLADSLGNSVSGTVTYDATSKTVTFTPSAKLALDTTYTATILGGSGTTVVRDTSGNSLAANYTWSFTTDTPTAGPTVTSVTPANNATGVDPAAEIQVTFSTAMDATTITTSTIDLRDSNNNLVTSTVLHNSTADQATLLPNVTLAQNTTYTVTVHGGSSGPVVKDTSGNALASNYVWSFTTGTIATSGCLLEDFSSMRLNGAGTNLWFPYLTENPNQSGQINTANHSYTLNVNAPNSGGSYAYFDFFPYDYGYPWPGGYMQSFVRNGTFTPTINRLSFWVESSSNVVRRADGGDILEIGTYIKPHDDTDVAYQGDHYYHQLDPNLYAGHWTLVTINEQPQHRVGTSGATTPSLDPEWTSPTVGSPVHYFDGLTDLYFNGLYTPTWVGSYTFKDFSLNTVEGEPDALVASVTATYNGTGYELTWAGPKNTVQNYDIAYSSTSMKQSGFASGTYAGTVQNPGSSYQGCIWQSQPMAQQSGIYFAIRPQGQTAFTEIYLPTSPPQ
jgi:methionine-rich copper-binding protein CopC